MIFLVPFLTQRNCCHQCFLLFKFPLKTGHVVLRKQFIVKNHNSLQSGLTGVPSNENTWNSNFFRLQKIYMFMYIYIYIDIYPKTINSLNQSLRWSPVNSSSNRLQDGERRRRGAERQGLVRGPSTNCGSGLWHWVVYIIGYILWCNVGIIIPILYVNYAMIFFVATLRCG